MSERWEFSIDNQVWTSDGRKVAKAATREQAILISSAPDLLEACRFAESIIGDEMEGCVSEGCSYEKPCSYCQDGRAAIKQIEQAIAKAEGKL